MAISWDDFDKIWASTSPLTPYSFSDNNYKQGWNFVGATPPARQMWDSIQKANDEKFKFLRDNFGTPNIVTTAAQMTDTDKIYVYVGSEAGWNNGHWYYYDAGTSAWVDGGVYNSTAFVTDTTLTEAGKAADAKAVGDALALKADLTGATFTGNVVVNADFSTTGNATFDADTETKGNATVDGNSTVKGDSDIQGNGHIDKDLTVDGTSDLKGDVTMEGNASVAKDFSVSGNTSLKDTKVDGTLETTGNVTASGNVSVVGDIDADNITLTGDISATDVTASGDVTANDASFANATLSGTLSVTGATTLDGLTAGSVSAQSLNTTGNASVGGTLTVSGATTLADITAGDITADDVTANGNLSVVGNATLSGVSTAVTPAVDDNSTNIATTAYVQTEIKPIEADVSVNDKRISNIEKLLQGKLYDYQTDTDTAYTKTVPAGAMPYAGLEQIGGKTVVMNQLVKPNNIISRGTVSSVGLSLNGTDVGEITIDGTSLSANFLYFYQKFAFQANHIYLLKCDKYGNDWGIQIGSTNTYTYGGAKIYNSASASLEYINFKFDQGVTFSNLSIHPQIIDLTLMFGAGNEPSTVAEFESMFPADYYEYNAGTLLSAGVTEVVSKDSNNATLQAYSIPTAIRNLEGYGWSARTAYNYIDYERKVFVKNVGRLVIDGVNQKITGKWGSTNEGNYAVYKFFTPKSPLRYRVVSNRFVISGNSYISMPLYSFFGSSGTNTTWTFVLPSTVTSVDEANAWFEANPTTIYYALDTPIETDISQYLTDDNLINVESGGTLTFENQHGDDYRLPVPSEETYMIDLQEAINNG